MQAWFFLIRDTRSQSGRQIITTEFPNLSLSIAQARSRSSTRTVGAQWPTPTWPSRSRSADASSRRRSSRRSGSPRRTARTTSRWRWKRVCEFYNFMKLLRQNDCFWSFFFKVSRSWQDYQKFVFDWRDAVILTWFDFCNKFDLTVEKIVIQIF